MDNHSNEAVAVQIRTFDDHEDAQPSGLIELPVSRHGHYKAVATSFLTKYPAGAVELELRYPHRSTYRWLGHDAAGEVGCRNVERWEACHA